MIHIPQNQNEVLHNRLRGGSDKEVPANSWGFQTRMGLGQNFQNCSDLCSEILELLPLLMRRKLPWHLFRTRGLPEMRIVPIWQILLLCKSFRILHSQDFKGMASLKEILHHSEISSISNEQIYWATKRCSFGSLIIFLMKTIFNILDYQIRSDIRLIKNLIEGECLNHISSQCCSDFNSWKRFIVFQYIFYLFRYNWK